MGACMCTYPTSFLARARVRGCPNAIIAYGFVKKWKTARVGDDRETRDSRRETETASVRAGDHGRDARGWDLQAHDRGEGGAGHRGRGEGRCVRTATRECVNE